MGRLLNYIDQHSDLMCRMMERLGIDVVAGAGLARGTILASAARRCFFCPHAARCRAWLDGGAGDEGHRAFCPNADLFDGLPRLAAPADDRAVRH